ncbi:MAG: bifunctional 2-polyprenyl-6-hydroxyphenol methylase/3-demethylubiquinol 3-O-methyltransferase UbiG, partial [Bacteriovoracia bacterium]
AYDDPVALLRAEGKARNPWAQRVIAEKLGSGAHRVLDLGCGAGFLTNYLATQGHEVTGLDLSESSLAVARAHDGTQRVSYVQGDICRAPFPDASFDVVCAMDVLEHIEDPRAMIRGAARLLRPGGLFFFHTFNRNPISGVVVIKGVEWLVKNTPPHMHVYRLFIKPRELAYYCRSVGLDVAQWVGTRPRLKPSLLKAIFTGVVPQNFEFKLMPARHAGSLSLLMGYSGYAVKK